MGSGAGGSSSSGGSGGGIFQAIAQLVMAAVQHEGQRKQTHAAKKAASVQDQKTPVDTTDEEKRSRMLAQLAANASAQQTGVGPNTGAVKLGM